MKFQFSAGGVVFKKEDGKTFVLVSQHSQHHGWVFPKGLIADNPSTDSTGSLQASSGQERKETKEEAALREVKEETGAEGRITNSFEPVDYWFVLEGEKIKKTVYYFLMEYAGGDITKHDHEMEAVVWLPKEEIEKRLTYPSDKKVWQEARKFL